MKKDVIALGFSTDYVGHMHPKRVQRSNKAESGRKGAQTTKSLLKQGENVTENVAALKAANPEYAKVVEKHTQDTRRLHKSKTISLFKIGKCSSWRNSK